ncbi:class I SAM-dependent methyltransferase [Halopenitus persicus]|uniref:Methyltransferase domain-containing protein n=1 Tax=Halopenitus persicus TaxID=1048396 RepID=A0A1H3FGI5_9EURY|nr:class I SAM-dependent methyltransferase [Halopenitus persicus]SDX89229.1 Methyltransferase domain-containing protein [Halopenitus persicus]
MSDPDYLTAKRTVDDRALNARVFDAFVTALREAAADGPVSVLDVGAGTGTMVVRLAERGVLPSRVTYRMVDRDPAHVAAARTHVPERLAAAGYRIEADEEGIVATRDGDRLTVRFEAADAFAIDASADVCIAMAVLDLMDPSPALEGLTSHLVPGGVLYAPIVFDGGTGFLPAHPDDPAIERAYHRHMAEVRDGGGPRVGRRLPSTASDVGGEVVDVGGSTQVIRPRNGSYPAREDVVLSRLLETVTEAVREVPDGAVTPETIDEWLAVRRDQLDRARLSFVAHNLDVLVRT